MRTRLSILTSTLFVITFFFIFTSPVYATCDYNVADGDEAGLISAVNSANSTAGEETICLASNSTYTFSAANDVDTVVGNSAFEVTDPLIMEGNGSTIEREQNADEFRLIFVNNLLSEGGALVLKNTKIQNGLISANYTNSHNGGGIYSYGGNLTLDGVTIYNNMVDGNGGGVAVTTNSYSPADVVIYNSTFEANSTNHPTSNPGQSGGGLAVINTDFTVDPNSSVDVQYSVFEDNYAVGFGGGIVVDGVDVVINITNIVDNYSGYGGGGIASRFGGFETNISNSIFISNDSDFSGGGIYLRRTDSTLTNLSIRDNTSVQAGGGIYVDQNLNTTLTRSLLHNNISSSSVAGGLYAEDYNGHDSELEIGNTTFSDNYAGDYAGAMYLDGDYQMDVTLINNTITGNSNDTTIYGNQGGLYTRNTDIDFANNLFSNNLSTSCIFDTPPYDPTPTITSLGSNLSSDSSCSSYFTATGDMNSTDPELDTLQSKGGLTQVYPLQHTSPALDAGNSTYCNSSLIGFMDQRNVSRLIGPGCDIGAFEGGVVVGGYSYCNNVTGVSYDDCIALQTIYLANYGPAWTDRTDWFETTTPCSWYGVTCSGGNVSELDLHNNNLDGTLLSTVGDFTNISVLDLGDNSISGNIPAEIGDLTSLTELDLSENQFYGEVPANIVNLTNLTSLDVGYNSLSSTNQTVIDFLNSEDPDWASTQS